MWLAFDLTLECQVALKFLNPDLLEHPTARERMKNEAKTLRRISHANVIDLFDLFEVDRSLVMVLEYAADGDLEGPIDRGGIRWAVARDYTLQTLAGLDAVHRQGVVHRDLKPGNILLSGGTAKVADFSVAHDKNVGKGMTRFGAQLGTPEYMSPEQIRGTEVDARTDIYAMGILLFEMLSGGVPFSGENDYDIWKQHTDNDVPVAPLRGRVPEDAFLWIQKAMAKDPRDRWQSADDAAKALRMIPADAALDCGKKNPKLKEASHRCRHGCRALRCKGVEAAALRRPVDAIAAVAKSNSTWMVFVAALAIGGFLVAQSQSGVPKGPERKSPRRDQA